MSNPNVDDPWVMVTTTGRNGDCTMPGHAAVAVEPESVRRSQRKAAGFVLTVGVIVNEVPGGYRPPTGACEKLLAVIETVGGLPPPLPVPVVGMPWQRSVNWPVPGTQVAATLPLVWMSIVDPGVSVTVTGGVGPLNVMDCCATA